MWRGKSLRLQSIRFQRLARRLIDRVGIPQRVGRGLAAGCFAAMLPVPLLRLIVSFVLAWSVHGSKTIAFLSQFLYHAIGAAALTTAQFWIGSLFWRGPAGREFLARHAVESTEWHWRWLHPIASSEHAIQVFSQAGAGVCGPLLIGCLILAILAALAAYPVGVICVVTFYTHRLRGREKRGLLTRRPRVHLLLPAPTDMDEAMTEAEALRLYARQPKAFVRSSAITLLIDGAQAYPEMLRAIAEARASVDLETYILRADHTGKRFGDALAAAARRGVTVRLLYDSVGALGLPQSYVTELLSAGVHVGEYKPLRLLFKQSIMVLQRRDHRKILVVDDRIGFAGGMNITDAEAPRSEGGKGWRDMQVRVEGPEPVRQLKALVDETWKATTVFPPGNAANLPPPHEESITATPVPPVSHDVAVQVLGNKELLQRVRLRRAYLHAIRNARRYVLIENAYFIPDRGIRRAMYAAVKRGVTVAAGVAMYSDLKIVAMASRALYSELIGNGVRLFEYPLSMLHSKVAVIDDQWSIVSSYNLDHRSLMHNLESGVIVINRPFAEKLRDQIMSDFAVSREVTREFHEARPWDEILMESLAYQVRYWL